MAVTYPGVYVREIPSGVRTIVGVSTSITAFIGRAARGPVNDATRIQSFADFERVFGGLSAGSTMSYAVQHFFLHGGRDAIIVRVTKGAEASKLVLGEDAAALKLEASSEGSWGGSLRAKVDLDVAPLAEAQAPEAEAPEAGEGEGAEAEGEGGETEGEGEETEGTEGEEEAAAAPVDERFNLTVQLLDESGSPVATETFRNLTFSAGSKRPVGEVLASGSALVRLDGNPPTQRPLATLENVGWIKATGGDDGGDITGTEIEGNQDKREGIHALDAVDLFNLMCIPPPTRDGDLGDTVLKAASKYCKDRRAFLIVDPPKAWKDANAAVDKATGVDAIRNAVGAARDHAAVYFPRLRMADPLQENRTAEFVPCGAVAGIMARTDASRGVWKAPAGTDATLSGVREFGFKLDDAANGILNPMGVNALRNFRVFGNVVWGARTLDGADQLTSEWKYVPVRRLALFLEESLYRGTQWAVFEPNDEPLWAELRLNIGAFMQNLFRQGAFQGQSARDAYFVKVDKETTTQNDIDLGIVNIVVGFAPLKPAEFVILKFQQMAGQVEA